jgi:ubiquinone biosynthesis protein UbiJ
MAFGPGALSASAFNRGLDRAPWALERLVPHAGRTFAIAVGPLVTTFRIAADGHVEAAPAATAPDLRLGFSPVTLPSFLAEPTRWNELVTEEGDVALGGTLKELSQTLPWLVEDAFARVLGAVVGQRAADTGRRLLAFPEYAAQRMADSVVSYARDEADLLARGDEMRPFVTETVTLAARVDALESRIDALTLAQERQSG